MDMKQAIMRGGITFVLFLAAGTIFAQTDTSRPAVSQITNSRVFAPFVSSLQATVDGTKIMLSWHDSESINGPVYVYRSQEPFYGGTMSNQFQVMQTMYGVQQLVDTVPTHGTWYYLVVASDSDTQRFEMVVPFNNMVEVVVDGDTRSAAATSWTVQQTTPQIYSRAQAESGRPNPPPAAFRNQALSYGNGGMGDSLPFADMAQSSISGLTATPQSDGILIQFLSPAMGKNAVLYRAVSPIRKFGDLLVASVIKLGVSSPFLDRATAGVPYYYAVVFEEDLMNGQASLVPGGNATLIPVELSRDANRPSPAAQAGGRYEPVPQGAQFSAPPASQSSRFSVIQGGGTVAAPPAAAAIPYTPSPPRIPLALEPRIFREDLQKPIAGTDEYDLALVVQQSFSWRNWGEARGALMKLLTAKKRSPAVDARAHFYLGECAYFLGMYREALNEFLSIQAYFPDEAAGWVQACLAKISTQ
ncbi:MAG: hypothetical protein LBD20_03170 [Spirochaetaceae bacterium]|jgi:hypothetical protein|nr:hypothetical protein [Spirochaetaceae bacterium]